MIILVVEDNRPMRLLLIDLVRSAFPTSTVLEAADADSATRLFHNTRPDLVLMDVALPDGNGIALTAQIKSLHPASRIVVVSSDQSRVCQEAAAAAGATAYVVKDDVFDKLLPAIALALPLVP